MFAIAATAVALLAAVVVMLLFGRRGVRTDSLDVGAVSTRWLAQIRRDDPWPR